MSRGRSVNSPLIAALLCVAGACGAGSARQTSTTARLPSAAQSPRNASLTSPGVNHFEYVFPDEEMYVYDIDHRQRLVEHLALPGIRGIPTPGHVPFHQSVLVTDRGESACFLGDLVPTVQGRRAGGA